jgi:hypothetical protein
MSEQKIDFTKVRPRAFAAQFRFRIDAPASYKNKAYYYQHYMSRWSKFISQVMAIRLSKTEIRETLPDIRNTLPSNIKLSDIYSLLLSHNQALARSLLDCSAVFDNAPAELKAHIVVCFGIIPEVLEKYLNDQESDAA